MARIRTIKPEIAAHEGLFDLERETGLPMRFAWCMLFTVADRDGRFPWRPRTLKAQILPHDEIDFSRVLDAWVTRGFVRKYRVGNDWYGWIPTFTRHQVINNRESPSEIPPIEEGTEDEQSLANASVTRAARVSHARHTREVHAQVEGKGKEGKEGKGMEGKGSAREPDPVDNLDGHEPGVISGKHSPPKDPSNHRNGSGSRRNGDFEAINDAISKLLASGVCKASDTITLAKLADVTESQAAHAVRQLRDRGRLPTGAAA